MVHLLIQATSAVNTNGALANPNNKHYELSIRSCRPQSKEKLKIFGAPPEYSYDDSQTLCPP